MIVTPIRAGALMAEEETHQFFSDTEEHQERAKAAPPAGINKKKSDKNKRYIVFVGNLPYEATKQDLETLFKHLGTIRRIDHHLCVEVVSVRMLSDKVTGKSKGTAFVEFADAENFQVWPPPIHVMDLICF